MASEIFEKAKIDHRDSSILLGDDLVKSIMKVGTGIDGWQRPFVATLSSAEFV